MSTLSRAPIYPDRPILHPLGRIKATLVGTDFTNF